MPLMEERRYTTERRMTPAIHGLSAIFGRRAFAWGAALAGAFAGSALQLLSGFLVDPSTYLLGGQIPVTGISTGIGIWYLLYTFGAMFVGGVIAGQTGGGSLNRMLHGLIAWALSSVAGFYGFAVWTGQLNIGPAIPLIGDGAEAGMALISRGWMFGGLWLGLCAALLGSRSAKFSED
jgi:hypothetical protein